MKTLCVNKRGWEKQLSPLGFGEVYVAVPVYGAYAKAQKRSAKVNIS